MADGFMLKFLEGLFYLIAGGCTLCGAWGLFRGYRRTSLAIIKTHITAYKLQKLVEDRSR